jgi:tetratricopeptide (TPR) repeat protein
MKKILFFAFVSVTMLVSCGPGTLSQEEMQKAQMDSLRQSINDQEDRINGSKMKNALDTKAANAVLKLYDEFVAKYPEDSMAAEYLFKAADIAGNALKQYGKSVAYYDQILKNYPSYSKTGDCLFLAGFTYQDKLGDALKAKTYYDRLIAEYPNHEFADDAKALISLFGKSDEEIIREFEKKNSQVQPDGTGK